MAGRGWGGFGCHLTQTLITAAAEPALHSRLRSRGCGHTPGPGPLGRCCSLGPCSWDGTGSSDLVGFAFQDCNPGLCPSLGRIWPQVEDTAPLGAHLDPFRSQTSAPLPVLGWSLLSPGEPVASFTARLGWKGWYEQYWGEQRGVCGDGDFLRFPCKSGLWVAVPALAVGAALQRADSAGFLLLQPLGNFPFTGTREEPANSAITTEIRAACAGWGRRAPGRGWGKSELELPERLRFRAGTSVLRRQRVCVNSSCSA